VAVERPKRAVTDAGAAVRDTTQVRTALMAGDIDTDTTRLAARGQND